ncbi:MAG: tetratricopeptide repeat protein, partial [Deltaproteobacteria bacterium]|nr:tetratricopeptide repeat protein [Deltaproteobacteria bacterium]
MRLAIVAGLICLLFPFSAQADRSGAISFKKKGDALLRKGSPGQAVKAYKGALRADRSYADAWGALAVHYLRLRKFASAEALLDRCVETLPAYPEGWYHLAYARRKRGKLRLAIVAYRTYAKLRPRRADPDFGIGLAFERLGDHVQAARAFRRYALLESSPAKKKWVEKALKLAVAAEGHARGQPRTGGHGKTSARASAVKAHPRRTQGGEAGRPKIEQASKTPERRRALVQKKRGDAFVKRRQYGAALTAFRRAIATDYTYKEAFNALANVLFALKRYEEAVRTFRVAIRDIPSYDFGWYNLAYALRKAGRSREAIAAYGKFSEKHPKDPDPHYGMGLAYQALGDKSSAIKAFNTFIALEGRPSRAKWVAVAAKHVRKLGGKPEKAGSRVASVSASGGHALEKKAPSGAKGLPPDVLAKALSAVGKGGNDHGTAVPAPRKKLSAKERRRLARAAKLRKRKEAAAAKRELATLRRAERKRKRAEAKKLRDERRQVVRTARLAKREAVRLAQSERLRKRKEARLAKREAVRLAQSERLRKRKEARLAKREATRLARQETKKNRGAARAGVGKASSPVVASPRIAGGAIVIPKAKPDADRPSAIPPPPRPDSVGKGQTDKLRVQGDSLARIGKCREAIPLYARATRADPFAVAAYRGVAYCAQRLSRYDFGIKKLRLALRDNPGFVKGYLYMARLRDTKGDYEAAAGSYRQYLHKRPKDLDARFELARALRHSGHKTQAIASYRAYLLQDRRPAAASRRAAAYAELRALGGDIPHVSLAAASKAPRSTGAGLSGSKSGLSADVFAKALAAAKGDVSGKPKASKRFTRAQKRHLAAAKRAEDRRIRREARLAGARAKRELRQRARRERLSKAKEAKEARRQARAEGARQRREARAAKISAKREARARRLARIKENRMLARLARQRRGGKKGRGVKGRSGGKLAPETALARRLGEDLKGAGGARPIAPRVEIVDRLKPAPDAARGLVAVADGQFAKRRYVVALGIYQQAARFDATASEPLYKAGVAAVALGRMHVAAELFERVLQIDPGNATARTSLSLARAASRGKVMSASYLSAVLSRAQADV